MSHSWHPNAAQALQESARLAARGGCPVIGQGHILLALLRQRNCRAARALEACGLREGLSRELRRAAIAEPGRGTGEDVLSRAADEALEQVEPAEPHAVLDTGDLLLALLRRPGPVLEPLFQSLQVDTAGIAGVLEGLAEPPEPKPGGGSSGLYPVIVLVVLTMFLGAGTAFMGSLIPELLSPLAWCTAGSLAVTVLLGGLEFKRSRSARAPEGRLECARCGFQTWVKGAFVASPEGLVCSPCAGQVARRARWDLFWGVLAVIVLGLVAGVLLPDMGVLVNLALLYLFQLVLIVPHELSHALAARALGMRLLRVQLGEGPRLAETRFLGVPWAIHALPLSGLTFVMPEEGTRFRSFLQILAGPASNLVLGGLPLLILRPAGVAPEGLEGLFTTASPLAMWVAANALLLVINLAPRTVTSGSRSLPTDGAQLLHLVAGPRFVNEAVQTMVYLQFAQAEAADGRPAQALEILEEGLRRHPDSVLLATSRGVEMLHLDRFEEARDIFRDLLQRESLSVPQRAALHNNLAWAGLHLGAEEALDHAERAVAAGGSHPSLLGTLGALLVRAGRLPEGRARLVEALERHADPRSLAINFCFLARADRDLGDVEGAREHLRAARHLDPTCRYLDDAYPPASQSQVEAT